MQHDPKGGCLRPGLATGGLELLMNPSYTHYLDSQVSPLHAASTTMKPSEGYGPPDPDRAIKGSIPLLARCQINCMWARVIKDQDIPRRRHSPASPLLPEFHPVIPHSPNQRGSVELVRMRFYASGQYPVLARRRARQGKACGVKNVGCWPENTVHVAETARNNPRINLLRVVAFDLRSGELLRKGRYDTLQLGRDGREVH